MEASSLIGTTSVVPLPWFKRVFHPTVLTAARIVLSPVIVIALAVGGNISALGLLVLAELTDFFDGYLARRWKFASIRGEWLDTMADKILHLPLFFYFLFKPKPELPHFFLIHDVVQWFGYTRLFCAILAIEVILLATRTPLLQDAISWITSWFGLDKYGELRVTKKKGAKRFGKIKTWIHAFSIGFFILAVVMVSGEHGHFHADMVAISVTAAQVLVMPAIIFAALSLMSRFTLILWKHKA
jgi:phosphatidylglycerophosphate synthase